MALIDNIGNIAFSSRYPIDKIVWESNNFTTAVSAGDPTSPGTVTATVPHGGGANTVVNGRFSIDNVNFYPFGAYITGDVISSNQEYLQLTGYNDEENVYVLFVQGFDNSLTVYWDFVMESLA